MFIDLTNTCFENGRNCNILKKLNCQQMGEGEAPWIFTHDAANANYLHSKHSFCEKHFNSYQLS